jgi:hypothetical protein
MSLFGKPTLASITSDLRNKITELENFSTMTVDEAADKRAEANLLHEAAKTLETEVMHAMRITEKLKHLLA